MSTPINNWPDLSNSANNYLLVNQITREIEKTYGDFLSVSLASGNVTLTDAQFRAAALFRATGNTVPRDLAVPALKKLFVVENTGSATLSVKRGTTTVLISAGSGVLLYTDATSNGLSAVAGGTGGSGGWDTLSTPAIASGVLTLDLLAPAGFKVTLDQNITSIVFANAPSSKVITFSLELVQDATGGRTVAWPGTITADDGGGIPAPAVAATASTIYTLQSTDGTNFKLFSGVENGFTVQSGAINEAPLTSIAAASTVNLATSTSNTITITGNTTVNALGTMNAGATRRLSFTGTPTLTHNATSLILPSGANIAVAAGDVAEFVSLGSGNWKCFSYQRANGTAVALGPTSSPTFSTLNLTGGQIAFPATQNPSSDPNTFDDYEKGTWTPALTFATPGNLVVAYSAQVGSYTKLGRAVLADFTIITSTFTHSTASGALTFTGGPFAAAANNVGSFDFQGVTKASYTHFVSRITSGSANITVQASGSGQARSAVNAADMPTTGSVVVIGSINYNAS